MLEPTDALSRLLSALQQIADAEHEAIRVRRARPAAGSGAAAACGPAAGGAGAALRAMMEAMAIPAAARAGMRLQPSTIKWQMYCQWRDQGGGDRHSAESQKDDAQETFSRIRVDGVRTAAAAAQLATRCKTAHREWLKTFLGMGGAGELCAQLRRIGRAAGARPSGVDRQVQRGLVAALKALANNAFGMEAVPRRTAPWTPCWARSGSTGWSPRLL